MTSNHPESSKRPPMALAGLGFELVAAIVGLAFVGYWIDRHYATQPWGVVIGSVLGIIGGLYNFIRSATRAVELDSESGSHGQ